MTLLAFDRAVNLQLINRDTVITRDDLVEQGRKLKHTILALSHEVLTLILFVPKQSYGSYLLACVVLILLVADALVDASLDVERKES